MQNNEELRTTDTPNTEEKKATFQELNLSNEVLRAISDMGFEEMSPIQAQAIPYLLKGVDVIGQAQTGTGKTAAFGIPIVEQVDPTNPAVQALVLCPTRELSIQVAEEIAKLTKYKKGVRAMPIYGGQPIDRQIRALKKGVNVVIGTPGRVIDHINRRTLKIGGVKMFVLDEADEMFDMGFRDDIERVINEVPEERQTTFFSATMAKEIMSFAKTYQKDPHIVRVVQKEMTVPKVDQFYYDLKHHMKNEILSRVLDIYNPRLAIVFCNTKRMVDELTEILQSKGYLADGLHGDLKQSQRDQVMNKFRKGTIDILLATDVAARGLDVDDVDLVINYDLPQDDEYYVHRIGRTARAGREGTAINFVTGRDSYRLRDIQKYTKTRIQRRNLPTLKDIESNQLTKIKTMVLEEIDKDDMEKSKSLINMLLEEDNSAYDVACALLSIYQRQNQADSHEVLDYVDNDKVRPTSGNRERDRNRPRDKKFRKMSDAQRIHINVGKRQGITPRHILAALVQETGIDRRKVGDIDVYDAFTYVEISKSDVKRVMQRLQGAHIKGSRVRVETARPRD